MAATYFGEVTELDSRAVWYSDEEDDEDEELLDQEAYAKLANAPASHDDIRSTVSLTFERFLPNPATNFGECIITLVSTVQFKNFKANDPVVIPLGQYRNLAKAFACQTQIEAVNEATLWLMFDQSNPWITGVEVSYLVEELRNQLYTDLGLSASSPVILLAKQYSESEHLEYLSNHISADPKVPMPFTGRPTLPPALVRNSFESSLFEQLTLTLRLAYVVCLPDPKNFGFDKTLAWPTIPGQIIEQRLNDDNLVKTLIFT